MYFVFRPVYTQLQMLNKVHASRKHLRTKVTPDLHLIYNENGENLGLVLNDKWKFLHKIICCGDLLESPPLYWNRLVEAILKDSHNILRRTNDNYAKISKNLIYFKGFMGTELFT